MYRGLEKDIIIERPIFIYQWTLTVHSHWCSRICRHHTHLCRIITVESKAKGLHIKAEFDTLQQLYLPQFTFRELLLKNLRAYTKHTQIKAIHCFSSRRRITKQNICVSVFPHQSLYALWQAHSLVWRLPLNRSVCQIEHCSPLQCSPSESAVGQSGHLDSEPPGMQSKNMRTFINFPTITPTL